ncbi:GAF domain-containing protein [Aquipuribacter hungaricus]|uniref:GAF domain-containing protein n=1 Tax=Aquipuribacter hungaricus TaxID=545624 RepID=A0ABV7WHW7_9MICO
MPRPSTVGLADERRLESLRRTQLLDQPAQETFDRLTRVAARALGVPVSLLSLLEADRQFVLSQHGLTGPAAVGRELDLAWSLCPHVVASRAPFTVVDARTDPRVSDNPAVEASLLVAYAGVPLRGPDGEVVGTMCAVSPQPRAWEDEDVRLLEDLAAAAEEQMRTRWSALDRRDAVLTMGHRLRSGFTALSLETENLLAVVQDPELRAHATALTGVVGQQAAAVEDALREAEAVDQGSRSDVDVAAVLSEVVRRSARRPAHADRPVLVGGATEDLVVRTAVGDLCDVLDGMVGALLRSGRGPVVLSAHADGDAVRFRVQDEGDGLPPEAARAVTARDDVTAGADRRGSVSLAERAVRLLGGRVVLSLDGPSSIDLLLPRH